MLRRRPRLGVTRSSAHGGQCGVHQQGGRPPHTYHILFYLRREMGGLEPGGIGCWPPPPFTQRRQAEIIWMSKIPPSSPLGYRQAIKPNHITFMSSSDLVPMWTPTISESAEPNAVVPINHYAEVAEVVRGGGLHWGERGRADGGPRGMVGRRRRKM